YVASGMYFARVRVGGKLIRKSLKTDRISKNREVRYVPMMPEMRQLLLRVQSENNNANPDAPVTQVKLPSKSACLGLHITIYDILFAARCIELGVDIPTV